MRIIHTADWHLGRIFQGLHMTDDQAHVLKQFVRVVEAAGADVVIIAGDLYDRAVPPPAAVELFDEIMTEIVVRLGVPVIAIAGNHDSPERIDYGHSLLRCSGFYVRGKVRRGAEVITLVDEHGPVHFCPFPYAEPAIVRDVLFAGDAPSALNHGLALATLIDDMAIPEGRAVAIAHGSVVGAYESESERPLWVSQAGYAEPELFKRFCYTALGHFHKAQRVQVDEEDLVIEYPGSLLKYGFSEWQQEKSVNLVDIDARGGAHVERIALQPAHDLRLVRGLFADLLARDFDFPASDYIKVELLDERPVIDALARLRARLPNILHVEQGALFTPTSTGAAPTKALASMDAEALFCDFFYDMTNKKLSTAEYEILRGVLAKDEERAA